MVRDEIHLPSSGVRLRRLAAQGGPPVLLLAGLGASPRAYGLQAVRPLPGMLRERGRSPWEVDLPPGAGSGDGAALLAGLRDAVAAVGDAAGEPPERVCAIGHSLGGMLLLGLACAGTRLGGLVLLGTALDLREGGSHLRRAVRMLPLARAVAAVRPASRVVPLEGLAVRFHHLGGRAVPLPGVRDQFHPGTTPGTVVRRFLAEAVRDLPIPLLVELADLFSDRGLRLGASLPLRDAVRSLRLPVLFVAGRQDRQMPLPAVRAAAESVPGARLLEVGEAGRGRGYGHVDLLTGRDAPRDVFDPLLRFLDDVGPPSS